MLLEIYILMQVDLLNIRALLLSITFRLHIIDIASSIRIVIFLKGRSIAFFIILPNSFSQNPLLNDIIKRNPTELLPMRVHLLKLLLSLHNCILNLRILLNIRHLKLLLILGIP